MTTDMTNQRLAPRPAAAVLLCAAVLASSACSTGPAGPIGPSAAELDRQTAEVMRAAFRDEGIAKVERLNQDGANQACSASLGAALPAEQARAIEAANLATVKAPADGVYLGDWKKGEALAQDGRGMTWTDKSAEPKANGGNCYNCHQIGKAEISHGTIGPSLLGYARLRGVSDPASPAARAMVEYTWGKLYNARAYNACSSMPRFGHMKLLDEAQMKDLMALLLDPKSPVNQ
jgi:sulfur-oxidizing protein SoxX